MKMEAVLIIFGVINEIKEKKDGKAIDPFTHSRG
jgi:hypothetical protein